VAGAVVEVLAGFVGGLLSGYFVSRTQVAYQLRADTTNEVRKVALEAQRTFRAWIARPAYGGGRGPGDYHGGDAVGEKIDALSAHFTVQGRWLDDTSREAVERIWEGFGQHFSAHMEACFSGDRTEEHRTAKDAEEWLTTDFVRLLHNVQTLPWYRRIFGR
jgi:hypothetical protein